MGLPWAAVPGRPQIDLDLTIDGERAISETTCSWAGAHVLTVHPRSRAPVSRSSSFEVRRPPGCRTYVVHMRLGPPGQAPSITTCVLGRVPGAPALLLATGALLAGGLLGYLVLCWR